MIENVRSVLSRHGIVLAGGMGDAAQCIHEMNVLMHGVRSEIKNAVEEYRDRSNTILDHESSVQARIISDTAESIATMLRGTRIPSPVQCKRVMAALRIIVKATWALQGILHDRPLQLIVALCKKAHALAQSAEIRHHAPTWQDVLAAAEPQADREYESRDRIPYECVKFLAEHKSSFSVNGMTVTVNHSNTRTTSVSDMLAKAMLVFDNHGDKFNVLVDAGKFNSYATVRFDVDANRGAGAVHRIESKKLKDANPKAFLIELLRVTGLHHNAASPYSAKTVFEADIPEFVDGFLKVLLDDIPDRSVPDFDEDNPKMLGERWDTYHVSTEDQRKATAIARSFYKRAAAVLGAFLVEHGPDCMPAHRDLGYMTAQDITGGGVTFTDLNKPQRMHDSEAWESLMDHLEDCAKAVTGPIHMIDGEARNGTVYFTWSGSARASA